MPGPIWTYALVGALTATLLTTTSALAGSGVGGVFNLGQVNTVDAQTTLSGNPGSSPQLKVVSTGSAAAIHAETNSTDPNGAALVGKNTGGGAGLKAIVNAGAPPLAINSSVRVLNLNADLLDGLDSTGFWKLGGNAGTAPGVDFLGTTDNKALELKVKGQRVLRLEPPARPNTTSPNLIGGFSGNAVLAGAVGATIAGGGSDANANFVSDDDGTVGGGIDNVAGDQDAAGDPTSARYAIVGGGSGNTASAVRSTVGGGGSNTASGAGSSAAGGFGNTAAGIESTIGGGSGNTASGGHSAVGGGGPTPASGGGSAVGGGASNTASGIHSTVAGGDSNTASGFSPPSPAELQHGQRRPVHRRRRPAQHGQRRPQLRCRDAGEGDAGRLFRLGRRVRSPISPRRPPTPSPCAPRAGSGWGRPRPRRSLPGTSSTPRPGLTSPAPARGRQLRPRAQARLPPA